MGLRRVTRQQPRVTVDPHGAVGHPVGHPKHDVSRTVDQDGRPEDLHPEVRDGHTSLSVAPEQGDVGRTRSGVPGVEPGQPGRVAHGPGLRPPGVPVAEDAESELLGGPRRRGLRDRRRTAGPVCSQAAGRRHDDHPAHSPSTRTASAARRRTGTAPAWPSGRPSRRRRPQVASARGYPRTRDFARACPARAPPARARGLPRGLGDPARAARRGRRRRHRDGAAPRAPPGLHLRQAHHADERPWIPAVPRSSTSTAAARSPSTGRVSWSATRSSGCPTTYASSTTCVGSRRR